MKHTSDIVNKIERTLENIQSPFSLLYDGLFKRIIYLLFIKF